MRIDVVSIFPDYLEPLRLSLVGKAIETGLVDLCVHDLRRWTSDRHRTVDDTPYGGGAGMVMRPEPWGLALDELLSRPAPSPPPGARPPRLIVMTPSGRPFDQQLAAELAVEDRLILACGRYEGIDARVVEHARGRLRTDEVSLGDYVLNGGEVAALAVIEAVVRLIPGVIGNPESLTEESHAPGHDALLEYPLYTKPAGWRGLEVPPVLFSGHHARIAAWRREQALERTRDRRPELLPADRQPVLIEAGALADAGELYTLQRAAYLGEGRRDGSFEIPPLAETYADARAGLAELVEAVRAGAGAGWLVARQAGRLIGSVRAERVGAEWVIGRLMVAPDRQNEGIGSRLMRAIEASAPEGCDRLRLFTGARSTSNLAFYARRGFVEVGREVHAPSGVELVQLAKPAR